MSSGIGWQFSVYGLLWIGLAREVRIELNMPGLAAGTDSNDLALRLPGISWISLLPHG